MKKEHDPADFLSPVERRQLIQDIPLKGEAENGSLVDRIMKLTREKRTELAEKLRAYMRVERDILANHPLGYRSLAHRALKDDLKSTDNLPRTQVLKFRNAELQLIADDLEQSLYKPTRGAIRPEKKLSTEVLRERFSQMATLAKEIRTIFLGSEKVPILEKNLEEAITRIKDQLNTITEGQATNEKVVTDKAPLLFEIIKSAHNGEFEFKDVEILLESAIKIILRTEPQLLGPEEATKIALERIAQQVIADLKQELKLSAMPDGGGKGKIRPGNTYFKVALEASPLEDAPTVWVIHNPIYFFLQKLEARAASGGTAALHVNDLTQVIGLSALTQPPETLQSASLASESPNSTSTEIGRLEPTLTDQEIKLNQVMELKNYFNNSFRKYKSPKVTLGFIGQEFKASVDGFEKKCEALGAAHVWKRVTNSNPAEYSDYITLNLRPYTEVIIKKVLNEVRNSIVANESNHKEELLKLITEKEQSIQNVGEVIYNLFSTNGWLDEEGYIKIMRSPSRTPDVVYFLQNAIGIELLAAVSGLSDENKKKLTLNILPAFNSEKSDWKQLEEKNYPDVEEVDRQTQARFEEYRTTFENLEKNQKDLKDFKVAEGTRIVVDDPQLAGAEFVAGAYLTAGNQGTIYHLDLEKYHPRLDPNKKYVLKVIHQVDIGTLGSTTQDMIGEYFLTKKIVQRVSEKGGTAAVPAEVLGVTTVVVKDKNGNEINVPGLIMEHIDPSDSMNSYMQKVEKQGMLEASKEILKLMDKTLQLSSILLEMGYGNTDRKLDDYHYLATEDKIVILDWGVIGKIKDAPATIVGSEFRFIARVFLNLMGSTSEDSFSIMEEESSAPTLRVVLMKNLILQAFKLGHGDFPAESSAQDLAKDFLARVHEAQALLREPIEALQQRLTALPPLDVVLQEASQLKSKAEINTKIAPHYELINLILIKQQSSGFDRNLQLVNQAVSIKAFLMSLNT